MKHHRTRAWIHDWTFGKNVSAQLRLSELIFGIKHCGWGSWGVYLGPVAFCFNLKRPNQPCKSVCLLKRVVAGFDVLLELEQCLLFGVDLWLFPFQPRFMFGPFNFWILHLGQRRTFMQRMRECA